MNTVSHIIELPFTYQFSDVLKRLSLDPLNSIDIEDQLIRVPLNQSVVSIQSIGTMYEPKFILTGLGTEEQLQRISSIFHFDRSLEKVNLHFSNTNLQTVFQKFEGTPIIKDFSLYANLIKSIIHQQLNLSFARTLTTKFVHTFGTNSEGVWFYPSPEKIALLDVSTFKEMQFSTRKAEYIIGISQVIASGELNLEDISEETNEKIIALLTKYRGIGPWTAESFLLFGLGRENLFPLADIGLQNSLKQLWSLESKPTKEEITAHFNDWSPFLSYAALYLWRNIE